MKRKIDLIARIAQKNSNKTKKRKRRYIFSFFDDDGSDDGTL